MASNHSIIEIQPASTLSPTSSTPNSSTPLNPPHLPLHALPEHISVRKREFKKNLISLLSQNFTFLSALVAIVIHPTIHQTIHDTVNDKITSAAIFVVHFTYLYMMFLEMDENRDLVDLSVILLIGLTMIGSSLLFSVISPTLIWFCIVSLKSIGTLCGILLSHPLANASPLIGQGLKSSATLTSGFLLLCGVATAAQVCLNISHAVAVVLDVPAVLVESTFGSSTEEDNNHERQ
ncbi:hypothetical protein A2U01_0008916, partial [Trifolium medium]|nr:hypothetical protein [Trifolium medium]